jgi:tetratricopeptide (TPR) repeat protein
MKRISVLLLATLLAVPVWAQVKTLNLESQNKKIAKSDAEIQDPKKKDNPKTWLNRGDLFQEMFAENTSGLWMGMTKPEVGIIIGKSDATKQEQIADIAYEVQVYSNKELYFENEKLVFWKQVNIADADLLFKAQQAYEKAIELDVQGKNTKKIKDALVALSDKMRQEGLCNYSLQNYKAAQRYFMASAACKLNPIVNIVDSVMIFYTGVVSVGSDVQDYYNAVKHFKLCLQHQYYDDGNVYTQLAAVYAQQKDTAEQEQILKEGFMKFPTNKDILVGLINFYLSSNEDPAKIIDLLNKAQGGDPTNASLYFVEGTLYEKLNRADEAMLSYQKSVDVDPKYYNGYYNMGTLHYNKAVEFIKESSTIKDWKSPKIKELEDKANEEYMLALEKFLKAYEIDPAEKAALETIKNIYFRFRNNSPEMRNLHEEYKAKRDAEN